MKGIDAELDGLSWVQLRTRLLKEIKDHEVTKDRLDKAKVAVSKMIINADHLQSETKRILDDIRDGLSKPAAPLANSSQN